MSSAESISFEVLSKETNNYENPVIYCNLANPITLSLVNKNVATNFQVRLNETSLYYDGRLLKTANVDLSELKTSISFAITIVTSADEEYICKMYIDIPYKTETRSVQDGNLLQTITLNGNAKFYQF